MATRDQGLETANEYVLLRLSNAFVLSLLLHAIAFLLLALSRQLGGVTHSPQRLLDVDLVNFPPPAPRVPAKPQVVPKPAAEAAPQPALPKSQIVAPPDSGKAEPPKETRLLSDRDNTVEKEMVHRGEPEAGPAAAPQPDRAPPPPKQARVAKAPPHDAMPSKSSEPSRLAKGPGLDELLPSAGQLVREGYAGAGADNSPAETSAPETERRDVLRYADALGPSGGKRGTLDFLPDVHEGDVTLLNTKADLFAPFVRRVAQRVFQNQIISLRRNLSHSGVSGQEAASVEAVMNRRGNLVSVRVTDQSATSATSIDRHLVHACQQAFFDLNPPPGAEAADGNIHFIFRTEVQVVGSPTGMVSYGALLMAGLL